MSNFSTIQNPDSRLLIGTSAGGRATLYVGLEHQGIFNKLGVLSPSLPSGPEHFVPHLASIKKRNQNIQVWLSAGTYEGSIYEDALMKDIVSVLGRIKQSRL